MVHFAPHNSAKFEGYYSKFRLPTGASLAFIVSAVPAADPGGSGRPYMISFTYVAADSKRHWQREYWPKQWEARAGRDSHGDPDDPTKATGVEAHAGADDFSITWETGTFGCRGESVYWRLHTDEVDFRADQPRRGVPWRPGAPSSTPAGLLSYAPLPVQWHVHTVDAACEFTFAYTDASHDGALALHARDRRGTARVHVEKNWAVSFPAAYTWLQARDHDAQTGLCVAGGSLFRGVQAYLVGYHGAGGRCVTFAPPTASAVGWLSLGLGSAVNHGRGAVDLDIRGWTTRLRVRGRCERDTFFTLAAPLVTGHAPGYSAQTFAATYEVEVYVRSWLRPWLWASVEKATFERGSLEFGGDFYKPHDE